MISLVALSSYVRRRISLNRPDMQLIQLECEHIPLFPVNKLFIYVNYLQMIHLKDLLCYQSLMFYLNASFDRS